MREFDINGVRLCEFQAKLFEESAITLDCSTKIFLRRFYKSDLLKTLDLNESAFHSLLVKDAFEELDTQYGPSSYGKVKRDEEILFWIGYLYRYISYTRDVPTRVLMKEFTPEELSEAYPAYHTQSMEWCVKSLLESHNLNEKWFLAGYRFEMLLRETYLKDLGLEKREDNKI